MTNPLPPDLFNKDEDAVVVDEATASGIWSLSGEHLVCIEDFAQGPAVVLVPSELVFMLTVPLPPMPGTVRRREALPFAIEDHIAEPLDQVHVALGHQQGAAGWLAGVVSHGIMREWATRLAAAGLARATILPDALSLPVPGEGAWSVDLSGGRAVVRTGDGSGFALPLVHFEAGWRAAGQPACIAYGEALPPHFGAAQAALDIQPLADRLLAPALDLRQGAYAAPRRLLNPVWRRIAMIAGIGLLALGGIATADTAALAYIAHTHKVQLRTMASGLQPPLVIDADLADTLTALAPDSSMAGPSRFLSLLSRTAAAMGRGQDAAQGSTLWRSVSFDGAAGTLTIEVEVDDIAALQRMEQALTRAGLSVQAGAASSEGGRAAGNLVIRAP